MTLLEHYRTLYEYEIDCNQKMLAMLDSVPETSRGDARFKKAVMLAGHLAVCRENWLVSMQGKDNPWGAWFDKSSDFTTLRPRFAALESAWTTYLTHLTEEQFTQNFEFSETGETNGEIYKVPLEAQTVQLAGHALYHRGQIALLVDQLGGETVDTDYVDWCWERQ